MELKVILIFAIVAAVTISASAMVCQDQIYVVADWTSNETVQYNTNVTSPDNVTYTPMDNSTFSVGIYNITATLNGATDCTFLLVVLANPVCPTNVSQPSDENLTTTSVIWSYPAENRIDLFPLTSNPANWTTFDIGVTNVIVSLTDYPEYTCTIRVEVKDEQPPQLTCPQNLDVNNSAVATWRVPMASDNSGSVLLSSTHRPGGYFPFNMSTEITYTAVDRSGNSASCSFNLTVVRDGSPEVTNCPSNINKMIPLGITTTTVSELWLQEPTATSPTGSAVDVSSDFNRTYMFSVGTTRVTYTFRDTTGASSKCRFFVSVTQSPDADAPVVDNNIECGSDVVQDAPPGTSEMAVTWVEPNFVDAVDGTDITVTQTKDSGNAFGPGTTEVLYVATDKSYNIFQCIISVTVNVTEDTEAPVITGCPNNITRWVGPSVTNVMITWTPPNATDNFQVDTFISSHVPGDEFPSGVQTKVNYTATDLVGQQDICTFYVIINVDSEGPVIMNCPVDINMFVAEMVSSLAVPWEFPVITDNSGMFQVDTSHESGEMFEANSVNPVVIEAVDEAGNRAVDCTFTVTVTVDPAPMLVCPSMILNDTVPGQAFSIVWWLDEISVTDDTIFTENSTDSTEMNPLQVDLNSPIMVTYTVEDKRGNVRSCTFQVVANDTEPPVWTPCPSDRTTPADPGTNSAMVSWDAPSVSDNSGETPIKITTPRSSQLFAGGTYTVIYSAEDTAGNLGTCQFLVTVTVDADIPTIANCPTGPLVFSTPTGQSSAIVTWDTITATDTADGDVPVTSNINPGDELSIGMHDVIYQAVDSSGNMAMCQFTVEVTDPEPPVITSCPDNIIAYALPQRVQTPVTWTTEATASDNSGSVILTSNPASGSLFNTGQTTPVEYSATDPSGNPSLNTCTFTVTVRTTDLISIRGVVTLDSIRGNGNFVDEETARESLEMDLADLLRGTSLAPVDFVDVLVPNSVTGSGNLRASFTLFFSPDSHYNEEEISNIFYNALGNRVSFDSANVIVADSFDLTVREFNGLFTLRSIVPGMDAVDFTSCCSDPNSASYQALLQTIYSYFDSTFGSMHLFRMSQILPLRQGSVIVPYTLTFDGASTVTLNDIEQAFNATVQDSSRELAQTDLFLTLIGGVGDTVEVCPAGYCSNGGTCDVTNMDTYAFECSCQSGFSGTQCENMARQLSTAEIIGIFLGVMGLILILMVCCCCCLWLMGATSRRYDSDEENLVGKAPPPMLLLPMDEEYFRRPPRRQQQQQRPIITEMPPEEPEPRPYRPPSPPTPPPPPSGPSFLHEDPFAPPPPKPQPMIYPPPPQHRRRPRSPPRQRKERPPSYYETAMAAQPPQMSRQILMLPPTAPRWRRMRDRIDRYLPTRGPRFRANRRPEPITSMDELPPGYHQGGGPIRRNISRRSDAPRFRGNNAPEQVGDMKRRLFYEFNY